MFSQKFGRLITAMVTPFKGEDREIDFEGLESLIDHLIKSGSTSLLITGTTGENPTLNHDEEWSLLKNTISIVKGRVPIIFGAGSNSTKTTASVSEEAVKNGADAVMLVVPYYNKPNQEGIFEHYSYVAERVKCPILLYNNPGRTCSYINADTIMRLNQKYPHIQAIKESRSDTALDTITELQSKAPNIEIYSGDDSLILPILSLGGVGVVSVASHIVGEQMKELVNDFLSGAYEKSCDKFNKLFPLFKALFSSPSPGPVKFLLSEMGVCNSMLRLPLTEPSEEVKEDLLKILSMVKN